MAVTKSAPKTAAKVQAEETAPKTTAKTEDVTPIEVKPADIKEQEEKTDKKKPAPKKTAAKKPAAKKPAAKKPAEAAKAEEAEEMKTAIHIQFDGRSYSQEDLTQIVKDIWQFDLNHKPEEIKTVNIYVKPEESTAYYVINDEVEGSFHI